MINAFVVSARVLASHGSLLPPFVTVAIAIATRNVLWALFGGVYVACFLIYEYNIVTAVSQPRRRGCGVSTCLSRRYHVVNCSCSELRDAFPLRLSHVATVMTPSGGRMTAIVSHGIT